ncbi:MAG: hypothetical protein QQN41_07460 [Nitrosopumilus sp.]
MKYKNITKGVLKFRAHDSKGIVKVFELKPGKEMESDRAVNLGGLEEVGKGKLNKKDIIRGD